MPRLLLMLLLLFPLKFLLSNKNSQDSKIHQEINIIFATIWLMQSEKPNKTSMPSTTNIQLNKDGSMMPTSTLKRLELKRNLLISEFKKSLPHLLMLSPSQLSPTETVLPPQAHPSETTHLEAHSVQFLKRTKLLQEAQLLLVTSTIIYPKPMVQELTQLDHQLSLLSIL